MNRLKTKIFSFKVRLESRKRATNGLLLLVKERRVIRSYSKLIQPRKPVCWVG